MPHTHTPCTHRLLPKVPFTSTQDKEQACHCSTLLLRRHKRSTNIILLSICSMAGYSTARPRSRLDFWFASGRPHPRATPPAAAPHSLLPMAQHQCTATAQPSNHRIVHATSCRVPHTSPLVPGAAPGARSPLRPPATPTRCIRCSTERVPETAAPTAAHCCTGCKCPHSHRRALSRGRVTADGWRVQPRRMADGGGARSGTGPSHDGGANRVGFGGGRIFGSGRGTRSWSRHCETDPRGRYGRTEGSAAAEVKRGSVGHPHSSLVDVSAISASAARHGGALRSAEGSGQGENPAAAFPTSWRVSGKRRRQACEQAAGGRKVCVTCWPHPPHKTIVAAHWTVLRM